MFLDGGRKPKYVERTHACTGSTRTLHKERPQPGFEPETFVLLEGNGANTQHRAVDSKDIFKKNKKQKLSKIMVFFVKNCIICFFCVFLNVLAVLPEMLQCFLFHCLACSNLFVWVHFLTFCCVFACAVLFCTSGPPYFPYHL